MSLKWTLLVYQINPETYCLNSVLIGYQKHYSKSSFPDSKNKSIVSKASTQIKIKHPFVSRVSIILLTKWKLIQAINSYNFIPNYQVKETKTINITKIPNSRQNIKILTFTHWQLKSTKLEIKTTNINLGSEIIQRGIQFLP